MKKQISCNSKLYYVLNCIDGTKITAELDPKHLRRRLPRKIRKLIATKH